MIKVCDAIMGTGKSCAAITYINEHPEEKFIYVTPYLDEAARIKRECPDLHFIEPNNKIKEYKFKKTLHTAALIEQGRNIATTHQAFRNYTPDMLEIIKSKGYTLIIDENVDILEAVEFHPSDLQIAVEAGYVSCDGDRYVLEDKEYNGAAFAEVFRLLTSRELIKVTTQAGDTLFYWALPPRLITSFKDVFILTYLFEGQSLHHLLKMYNIPYEQIGVHRTKEGGYRFGSYPGYIPSYVFNIKDKLHILEHDKLNSIGEDFHSLSANWFKGHEDKVDQLKKNISNCFNNIWRGTSPKSKLWSTYNGALSKIKGKGYTNRFLTFNTKATNAYKGTDRLVYAVNPFLSPNEKIFYNRYGIEVDEGLYALSIMVQWIWRSAIRDGKEVYIYIPSRRMRDLLLGWLEKVSKGEHVNSTEDMTTFSKYLVK